MKRLSAGFPINRGISSRIIDLSALFPREVTEFGLFHPDAAKVAVFESLLEAMAGPVPAAGPYLQLTSCQDCE